MGSKVSNRTASKQATLIRDKKNASLEAHNKAYSAKTDAKAAADCKATDKNVQARQKARANATAKNQALWQGRKTTVTGNIGNEHGVLANGANYVQRKAEQGWNTAMDTFGTVENTADKAYDATMAALDKGSSAVSKGVTNAIAGGKKLAHSAKTSVQQAYNSVTTGIGNFGRGVKNMFAKMGSAYDEGAGN